MVNRLLTEKIRAKLKAPMGELLKGEEDKVRALLSDRLRKEKPKVIVSVGDKVSETLVILGFQPKLVIYDEKTERIENHRFKPGFRKLLTATNPSGMITEEAFRIIKEALDGGGSFALKVEGEEDLLTLPAIFYAAKDAMVVYGQPGEGVVLVKVTEDKRKQVKKIIEKMEVTK